MDGAASGPPPGRGLWITGRPVTRVVQDVAADDDRQEGSTISERKRISSGSPYEPAIGFSRAVRAGDRVLVAGTGPVWPDGSCHPDPERQAARCLEIIQAALREAGAGAEDVVRTRIYITDAAAWEAVGRAHGRVFGHVRPAASMVVVAGLLDPRWQVEIEAEAMLA
jgi:enamine deaminase RidA (YjgF/YER057c/UK114 family)